MKPHNFLQTRRFTLNLSQLEVALLLDVTVNTVSRWELELVRPTHVNQIKIDQLYGKEFKNIKI